MKKRAMKKYIPKNTLYCYTVKYVNGKRTEVPCKYWVSNSNKPEQLNGYCKFLKQGDWMEEGTFLLWDQCKECKVSHKNLKFKVVKTIDINNKKIDIVDIV